MNRRMLLLLSTLAALLAVAFWPLLWPARAGTGGGHNAL